MINPNEIHVGNYIQFKGEYIQISRFFLDKMKNSIGDKRGEMHIAEPILLDDAWIIKLGFKNVNPHEFALGEINLRRKEAGSLRWVVKRAAAPFTIIQYVHQLQNLYFAITQKELNIQK